LLRVPLGKAKAGEVPFISVSPLPLGNISARFGGGAMSVPSGRTNTAPAGIGNQDSGLVMMVVPGGTATLVVEALGPSIVMTAGPLPASEPSVRITAGTDVRSTAAVPFGNTNCRVPLTEGSGTLIGGGGLKAIPSAASKGRLPPGSIDGRSVVVPAGSTIVLALTIVNPVPFGKVTVKPPAGGVMTMPLGSTNEPPVGIVIGTPFGGVMTVPGGSHVLPSPGTTSVGVVESGGPNKTTAEPAATGGCRLLEPPGTVTAELGGSVSTIPPGAEGLGIGTGEPTWPGGIVNGSWVVVGISTENIKDAPS
jgi:hypothetical protein